MTKSQNNTPAQADTKARAKEIEIQKRREEAGKRALEEAKARKAQEKPRELPTELGGRNGPEPTRFGDWEKKGIVSDF